MANPEWDNYANGPEIVRYRLMSDDSGHRYYIPIGMEKQFERWVENEGMPEKDTDTDFNACRIDGHFTFTDPRCE